MKKVIKQIPNFITLLNLVSGSLAVFFAIDGHLTWAGIFICFAAVLDFFDGLAARILKAYSDLGKQLDSLADLVSFGLAPAAVLFTLLELSMFQKNQPIHFIAGSWDQWLILFSVFLMPAAGAIRLARFNIAETDELFFRGLPIPSNGLFWAAMGFLIETQNHAQLFSLFYSTRSLFILGLFTSGLMIISMPMFSLKMQNFGLNENWYRYVFILIALILLVLFKIPGFALVVLTYIFLNIVFYLAGIKY